jgi:hypothetical protein
METLREVMTCSRLSDILFIRGTRLLSRENESFEKTQIGGNLGGLRGKVLYATKVEFPLGFSE